MLPKLIEVAAGNGTWLAREDAVPPVGILKDPDSFLSRRDSLIKDSAVVTIGRVPPASAADRTLILRRLNYRKWRHCVRDFFRTSRAKTALLRGLALERAGVSTPRALAVMEVRRCRWPVRAYLITEEVPNALGLGWTIRQKPKAIAPLTRKLAAAMAKMHNTGFSHRDLKPSNILVSGDNEIAFIDLDAVRQFEVIPRQRALDDLRRLAAGLAGFDISALQFGRFLQHYCRLRGLDWQHWWGKFRAEAGRKFTTETQRHREGRFLFLSLCLCVSVVHF